MISRCKATLFDAKGMSDLERAQAEQLFCDSLADTLGGADQIAPVYLAYRAATDGKIGLANCPETPTAREAVVRWIKAESVARGNALRGLVKRQRARFEIGAD